MTNNLKTSLLKQFKSQKRLQNECIQYTLKRETEFGSKINSKYAEGFRLLNYISTNVQRRKLLRRLNILEAVVINNKLKK